MVTGTLNFDAFFSLKSRKMQKIALQDGMIFLLKI